MIIVSDTSSSQRLNLGARPRALDHNYDHNQSFFPLPFRLGLLLSKFGISVAEERRNDLPVLAHFCVQSSSLTIRLLSWGEAKLNLFIPILQPMALEQSLANGWEEVEVVDLGVGIEQHPLEPPSGSLFASTIAGITRARCFKQEINNEKGRRSGLRSTIGGHGRGQLEFNRFGLI